MTGNCQNRISMNNMQTKTVHINLDQESQALLIQWMKWNDKLNALPAQKAVNAVRTWSDLIKKSLEVKVWNN